MQIYENAVTTDWSSVLMLFVLLGGMYCVTTFLNLFISILRGRKQQIFNRYKLYLLFKRIYANDIAFFIDTPSYYVKTANTANCGAYKRIRNNIKTI